METTLRRCWQSVVYQTVSMVQVVHFTEFNPSISGCKSTKKFDRKPKKGGKQLKNYELAIGERRKNVSLQTRAKSKTSGTTISIGS